MANFQTILSDYEEFWRFANNSWSPYLGEAQFDLRAFNGDSWSWNEKDYLRRQGRTALELNQIRPAINFFSGYFRDTMTSVSVQPVESSDQMTADQLGKLMVYTYDKGDGDHTIGEAVNHAFKTGISLIGFYMDYSVDPIHGDIKFFWKPYNSFMLDPYFKKRDLSDCEQAILRDYVSRDQAKVLLPFLSPKEIDTLPTNTKDSKFLTLPERNKFFDNTDLLTYDQYYRRTSREVELLVDLNSGITQEIPKNRDAKARVKEMVSLNEDFDIIKRSKPTVELNIVIAEQVVYSGPDPTGIDDFPFASFITYYDPDLDDYSLKLQGLVRGMRDGQREFNKRHSKFIDIMDKNLYSGYMYKPSKLVDQESVFQTGQGPNIALTNDAVIGPDIQPNTPPPLPAGMLQYQQVLDGLLPRLLGINEDMVGQSEGGNNLISGALAQIRASNGLRSNRTLFDNMEYTQKKLAGKVLEAIQKNYGPAKVQRIINEEPTEQFYETTFERYDAQIVQTVKSQNQKQQFYVDLLQARQMGVDIPDDLIIEAMPMQNKSELLERMEQMQEQKAVEQEKQNEAEAMAKKLASAKAVGDVALAVERIARAEADSGLAKERISEMQKNAASANLDNVKAAKEIQTMDLDNAIRTLQLIQQMTTQTMAQVEAMDQKEEQESIQAFQALNQIVEEESKPTEQKLQEQQLQQQQLQQQGVQNG